MAFFDAKIEALETEDALPARGTILMFGSAEGKVKKAAGAATDILIGWNEVENALAGKVIGVTKPRNGMVEEFVLDQTRTTDIAYGDEIVVSADTAGSVKHPTDSANGKKVGYAKEAVLAATTKAKILVEVRFE